MIDVVDPAPAAFAPAAPAAGEAATLATAMSRPPSRAAALRAAPVALFLFYMHGSMHGPGPAAAKPRDDSPTAPLFAAVRAGRYAEAAALHRRLAPSLRDPAQRALADALYGQALLAAGKSKEAIDLLEAAVARDDKAGHGGPTEARLQLGLSYRLSGQSESVGQPKWGFGPPRAGPAGLDRQLAMISAISRCPI
jgi:tetratricopeptide (TPR) repeat protein